LLSLFGGKKKKGEGKSRPRPVLPFGKGKKGNLFFGKKKRGFAAKKRRSPYLRGSGPSYSGARKQGEKFPLGVKGFRLKKKQ